MSAQLKRQLSRKQRRRKYFLDFGKSQFIGEEKRTLTQATKMFIFYSFVIFILLSQGESRITSENRCIPLRRCESVQWLITNLARLPSDKRSTVVRQISRMQCGINEQSEILIFCPTTISDNFLSQSDIEERGGGAFSQRSGPSDCIGSVKVSPFYSMVVYSDHCRAVFTYRQGRHLPWAPMCLKIAFYTTLGYQKIKE